MTYLLCTFERKGMQCKPQASLLRKRRNAASTFLPGRFSPSLRAGSDPIARIANSS
jgi:hypothetical protein